MTMTQPARCPNCDGTLTGIDKPCPSCGLGFVRRWELCPHCHETYGTHILTCRPEAKTKAAPILCPLCGMKRHRKDARVSRETCLWRQWALDTRQAKRDDPTDAGPERSATTQASFDRWLQAHPNIEGGSVPAERILRQAAREKTRESR